MPSTRLTVKARGLHLTGNDMDAPDGALAQADNVVISRDNILESRRGMAVVATKTLTRLFPWKERLVGYSGSTLSYSSADCATWYDYTGSFSPPTSLPLRFTEAGGNGYFTTSTGIKRLDALSGTPESAGVPPGLDMAVSVSAGAGTAVPTANQVAYRCLFGKKDASGRVMLGAPSGRAVISNTSGSTKDIVVSGSLPQGIDSTYFFQLYRSLKSGGATVEPNDELGLVYESAVPTVKTATQLARSSGTVTVSATAHGYGVGTIVRISPGGSTGGIYCAVGQNCCATSPDGITWTSRTIPAGTYNFLAWSGSVFAAVGNSSVCATSPDGITWTSRTITAGSYSGIAWNSSVFAAVGSSSACATSPDGITWTGRTIPAGNYYAVTWNGSIFVAVGQNCCATSPDGITWTSRTIPYGSYYGISWNGSVFSAVGTGVSVTSTDGITWTPVSIPSGNYGGIAWSGSIFAAIGTSSACATSPTGSAWTDRTISTGDYYEVAWNGSLFVAVGASSACATSPDGITWTARTISAGTYYGIAASGALFPSGEKTIATSSTNSFTYTEAGGNGTLVASQTLTPLTFGALDTVPDGFMGAALYTNPNQDGILQQHDRPPLAGDVVEFKGYLFAANLIDRATGDIYLLATGGSNGLQVADTVTINGLAYTAAAAEDVDAREFQVFTAGTVSQNIRDTAASLIRVVNRSLSSGTYAVDISDPDSVPGHIQFTAYDFSSGVTITFSRTTAWSPAAGIDKDPETTLNGIAWSRDNIPDGMPAVANRNLLGSADQEIMRLLATRDSLWALKPDGIWRITGNAGLWTMDPFDPTIHVVAPETAVVLDNAVWALSEQGVVRITDTGVQVVSRPIEIELLQLLASGMRSVTATYAFGVAYESDRKYMLWLPSEGTDTVATQAYVYDLFTQAWTRRTDSAAHSVVNPYDDRLYKGSGSSIYQERKSLDRTDFADQSYSVTVSSSSGYSVVLSDATNVLIGDALVQGALESTVLAKVSNTLTMAHILSWSAGAVTSYRAIANTIEWTPRFTGGLNHFKEVSLWFGEVYFANADLGFRIEYSSSYENVAVLGSDYSWISSALPQLAAIIRCRVPLEVARGAQLSIRWQQSQARCQVQIRALELVYSPTSLRVSK